CCRFLPLVSPRRRSGTLLRTPGPLAPGGGNFLGRLRCGLRGLVRFGPWGFLRDPLLPGSFAIACLFPSGRKEIERGQRREEDEAEDESEAGERGPGRGLTGVGQGPGCPALGSGSGHGATPGFQSRRDLRGRLDAVLGFLLVEGADEFRQ